MNRNDEWSMRTYAEKIYYAECEEETQNHVSAHGPPKTTYLCGTQAGNEKLQNLNKKSMRNTSRTHIFLKTTNGLCEPMRKIHYAECEE